MSDGGSAYLVTAVIGLASTVSSLAVYIWRQEVKRRQVCEQTLEEYEAPARIATAELLANARSPRRQVREDAGDPWPWPDSGARRRPRTPRRRS